MAEVEDVATECMIDFFFLLLTLLLSSIYFYSHSGFMKDVLIDALPFNE
jgi:hypothetical protein